MGGHSRVDQRVSDKAPAITELGHGAHQRCLHLPAARISNRGAAMARDGSPRRGDRDERRRSRAARGAARRAAQDAADKLVQRLTSEIRLPRSRSLGYDAHFPLQERTFEIVKT